MTCDRCMSPMEHPASFDGPPLRRYCDDCTTARLGEVMTLRCNRPVSDNYCRLPMGHGGDHEQRGARRSP